MIQLFIFFFRFFSIIGYYRILNIVSPPLTSGDRPSRQKVSKITEILTDTTEQLYSVDISRSLWASLVAQIVKDLLAIWETWERLVLKSEYLEGTPWWSDGWNLVFSLLRPEYNLWSGN